MKRGWGMTSVGDQRPKLKAVDPEDLARLPPQNLDAERSVLGSILMDNSAYKKIEGKLQEADFYREAHRKIFGAMRAMAARGIAIDDLTLCENLEGLGQLDEVGGRSAITSLTDGIPITVADGGNIQDHARIVSEKATARRLSVSLISASEKVARSGFDENDKPGGCLYEVQKIIEGSRRNGEKVRDWSSIDLSQIQTEKREIFLDPIIREKSITMIHAARGTGKTKVALGISAAAATGGRFLRWGATKPIKVLHVDGELVDEMLKTWTMEAFQVMSKDFTDNLRFYALGLLGLDQLMPDLSEPKGQKVIESLLDGVRLLVLDNVSTLFRSGIENEAESWSPIQDWLLKLRKSGLAILLIHHSGKSGLQRGTSKREDILDTIIKLSRPEDYNEEEGCRFSVKFEKDRYFFGKASASFDAKLVYRDNWPEWEMSAPDLTIKQQILELASSGSGASEIMRLLGTTRSMTFNILRDAKKQGLI
jgi:putative DNA primase/helicase